MQLWQLSRGRWGHSSGALSLNFFPLKWKVGKWKKIHRPSNTYFILWKIPIHFLSWVHINANRVSFPNGTINRVIFKEGQRLLQDETLVLQGCQEMDNKHRPQSSTMVPKPHAPSQARTTAKAGRDSNGTLTPNRARRLGLRHPPPLSPPTPSPAPRQQTELGWDVLKQQVVYDSLLISLENKVLGALEWFFTTGSPFLFIWFRFWQ